MPRWGVILLLVCPAAGSASQHSDELISEGAKLIDEGRDQDAWRVLGRAVEEAPNDPEAQFFAGAALNRLGRPSESIQFLQRARALGDANPDLAFETGWSRLMLRQWQAALEELQAYESQHPGRAQTSEFLGRAYLGLGKYEVAKVAFRRAVALDPDLKPTVAVYEAVLDLRSGDWTAARDTLPGLLARPSDFAAARLERDAILATPENPAHPWWLAVSLGGGYDSNTRGVTGAVPGQRLPTGGASAFGRGTVDAGYAFDSPGQELAVSYRLLSDTYVVRSTKADLIDQYASVDYTRDLGGPLIGALHVWDLYTLIGGANNRNHTGGQANLDCRIVPAFTFEASYAVAQDEYLFPAPPDVFGGGALVESGLTQTLTLCGYITPQGSPVQGRLGYFHVNDNARGKDFDFHGDGLLAGLSAPLPWKITAEISYTHSFNGYENPNTVSDPFARRRDEVDIATLRLSKALSPQVSAYLEYDYNSDRSSLRVYRYEEHVVCTGLVWRF